MDLRKMFAKHVYDKIFRSRICRELSKPKLKKNRIRKSEKDMCIHFTKNEIWMANKHKKILSLTTSDMKIKINVKYH